MPKNKNDEGYSKKEIFENKLDLKKEFKEGKVSLDEYRKKIQELHANSKELFSDLGKFSKNINNDFKEFVSLSEQMNRQITQAAKSALYGANNLSKEALRGLNIYNSDVSKEIGNLHKQLVDELKKGDLADFPSIQNLTNRLNTITKETQKVGEQLKNNNDIIQQRIIKGVEGWTGAFKKSPFGSKIFKYTGLESATSSYLKHLDIVKKKADENEKQLTKFGMTGRAVFSSLSSGVKSLWKFMTGVGILFAGIAVAGIIAGGIWSLFNRAQQRTVDASKETGMTMGQTNKEMGKMVAIQHQLADMGAQNADVWRAQSALIGQTINSSTILLKNVAGMAVGLGMGADESAGLLLNLRAATGSTDKGAVGIANMAVNLAKIGGVKNAGLVLKDMAANSNAIYSSFKGNIVAFTEAAVRARRLGMELKTMVETSSKLLDWDSSIDAEMEASVMLGKQIDFSAARAKAFSGDIAGATESVLDQVEAMGGLNNLNQMQVQAIEKASGMSADQLQRSIKERELLNQMSASEKARYQNAIASESKMKELTKESMLADKERTTARDKFKNSMEILKDKVIAKLTPLMGQIEKFVVGLIKGFDQMTSKMMGNEGAGQKLANMFNNLGKILPTILEVIKTIANKVMSVIEFFSSEKGQAILKMLPKILLGLIALKVGAKIFGVLGAAISGLIKTAGAFGGSLKLLNIKKLGFAEFQNHLKSLEYTKTELAASTMKTNQQIANEQRLNAAKTGKNIGGAGGAISKTPDIPGTQPGLAKKMLDGAKAMFVIAAAVLVLAIAFKIFSYVDWPHVAKGVIAMGALIGAAYLLSKFQKDFTVGAGLLITLAFSVAILAGAMLIFNYVDWDSVWKGIIVIGALVVAVALLALASKFIVVGAGAIQLLGFAMLTSAVAFILFGVALKVFTQSLVGLASVDWMVLLDGLAKFGVLMVGLAVIASIAAPIGLALLPLSLGLIMLGLSLLIFNKLGPQIGNTMTSVGEGLGKLAIVLKLSSDFMLSAFLPLMLFGAGLLVVGAALALFAITGKAGIGAFNLMTAALVNFQESVGWLGLGFITVAGLALIVFGAGLLTISTALVMFAIAGKAGSEVLLNLGNNLKQFIESTKTIEASAEDFKKIGEIIGHISGPLNELGIALTSFSKVSSTAGQEMAGSGAHIKSFMDSLGGGEIYDSIEKAGEALEDFGPAIAGLGNGIKAFGEVTTHGQGMFQNTANYIKEFANAIYNKDVRYNLTEGGKALKEFAPNIEALGRGLVSFNTVGPNASNAFIQAADAIKSFTDKLYSTDTKFNITEVGKALNEIGAPMESLGKAMLIFEKITSKGKDSFSSMATALKNFTYNLSEKGGSTFTKEAALVGDAIKKIEEPIASLSVSFYILSKIKGKADFKKIITDITSSLNILIEWSKSGKDGQNVSSQLTSLVTALTNIAEPLSKVGEGLSKANGAGGDKIIKTLNSLIGMEDGLNRIGGKDGVISSIATSIDSLSKAFSGNTSKGLNLKIDGGMPEVSAEKTEKPNATGMIEAFKTLGEVSEKIDLLPISLDNVSNATNALILLDKPFIKSVTNIDAMLTGLVSFTDPLIRLSIAFMKVSDAMRSFGGSIEIDKIDKIYEKWSMILSMEKSHLLTNLLSSGTNIDTIFSTSQAPAGDWATRRQQLDGGNVAANQMTEGQAAQATAQATMFLAEQVEQIKIAIQSGVSIDLNQQKLLFSLNRQ